MILPEPQSFRVLVPNPTDEEHLLRFATARCSATKVRPQRSQVSPREVTSFCQTIVSGRIIVSRLFRSLTFQTRSQVRETIPRCCHPSFRRTVSERAHQQCNLSCRVAIWRLKNIEIVAGSEDSVVGQPFNSRAFLLYPVFHLSVQFGNRLGFLQRLRGKVWLTSRT